MSTALVILSLVLGSTVVSTLVVKLFEWLSARKTASASILKIEAETGFTEAQARDILQQTWERSLQAMAKQLERANEQLALANRRIFELEKHIREQDKKIQTLERQFRERNSDDPYSHDDPQAGI